MTATEVRVAAGPLARPVIGRVVAALAGRSGLPPEAVGSALRAVAAITAAGAHEVRLALRAAQEELEMVVGPLPADLAAALARADALAGLDPRHEPHGDGPDALGTVRLVVRPA